MRIAYADPPYPGQSRRHYGDHPDYAGEVDHAALLRELDEYDGWALSTSAAASRDVWTLAPADTRLAIWNVSNSAHPGNRGTWWWSWEAVIVKAARPPAMPTRDTLTTHHLGGFHDNVITGQKPPAFVRWVLALLGADVRDEIADLFPGSGAVAREVKAWKSQPWLTIERPEQLAYALAEDAPAA